MHSAHLNNTITIPLSFNRNYLHSNSDTYGFFFVVFFENKQRHCASFVCVCVLWWEKLFVSGASYTFLLLAFDKWQNESWNEWAKKKWQFMRTRHTNGYTELAHTNVLSDLNVYGGRPYENCLDVKRYIYPVRRHTVPAIFGSIVAHFHGGPTCHWQ